MKQRATALTNSQLLDQLCDLLIPKLEERLATRLSSKQRVVGSNPARDATKLEGHLTKQLPTKQSEAEIHG